MKSLKEILWRLDHGAYDTDKAKQQIKNLFVEVVDKIGISKSCVACVRDSAEPDCINCIKDGIKKEIEKL